MYKRFSIEELQTVQNNFIRNFYGIIKKEHCTMTTDFFKKIFKEWDDVYYFYRWEAIFRCSKNNDDDLILMDEKEKVQLVLDEQGKKDFQSIFKEYLIKKEKVKWQKSIEQILMDAFQEWILSTILWKKYLVYDIETIWSLDDLSQMKFTLAYAMEPNAQNKMTYEYIDQEWLHEFVQKMLDFDGYIVWYNNIRFDNPVCISNTGRWQDDLQKLNEKSIDLYVLIRSLTGKRMGLNKVSEALVGISKTLESWAEWEILYQKFLESGDKKHLEELKQYCKNDVRMTALVLLYLMHFKKVFIEWEEVTFTLEDVINKANREIKEVQWGRTAQNIFE